MKKSEFLAAFEDILQTEGEIEENQKLEDLDEWDSLSKMATMAYFQQTFGIELTLNYLKDIKTPSDLIKLAGDKIND